MKNKAKVLSNFILILVLVFVMQPSFVAEAHSFQNCDSQNVVRMLKNIESNLTSSVIKKVGDGEKEKLIYIEHIPKDYIDTFDVYKINNIQNNTITLITDIKLSKLGIEKIGLDRLSSASGSVHEEKDFGRVTGYVKVWYDKKAVGSYEGYKITKIGVKVPYVQNGIRVIKLRARYGSIGKYFTPSGNVNTSGGYTKKINVSLNNLSSLKMVDPGVNRYYIKTGGAGLLRGDIEITYSGTRPGSSSITYTLDAYVFGF